MSFLKKVITAGLIVAGFVAGGWFAIAASNVALGLAARKLQESAIRRQERRNNKFKDVQPPKGENRIPVIYGQAFTPGVITDAAVSGDRRSLFFAVIISEKTGPKISDGLPSQFVCRGLRYQDQRVILKDDGVTFDRLQNIETGVNDERVRDRIKVWLYDGNTGVPMRIGSSNFPSGPQGHTLFPGGWDVSNTRLQMRGLVFAVVQVIYDSKNGITQLEDLQFEMSNSMTLPGDVIFDYMTSERSGAGIKPEDIEVV